MRAKRFKEWIVENEESVNDHLFSDWYTQLADERCTVYLVKGTASLAPNLDARVVFRQLCENTAALLKSKGQPIVFHLSRTSNSNDIEVTFIWSMVPLHNQVQLTTQEVINTMIKVFSEYTKDHLKIYESYEYNSDVYSTRIAYHLLIHQQLDKLTVEELLTLEDLINKGRPDTVSARVLRILKQSTNYPPDVTDWALDDW